MGEIKIEEDVVVFGFYQILGLESGRIVLYGDFNCFDNVYMEKGNFLVIKRYFYRNSN